MTADQNIEGQRQGAVADLDIHAIMKLLPHRYPLLLLDKLTQIVPGESEVRVKNVTINEPFFVGHFPQQPIMPGVMIVEAQAQTAAALVVHTLGEEAHGKLVYFMSVENARFRKPVEPGATLHLAVSKEQARRNVWRFKGEAQVDGSVAAEASFTAMIVDN